MRDGEVLGAMTFSPPDWPPGSIIYRGEGPNLRVVDRIEPDDPEHHFAILVVEAV